MAVPKLFRAIADYTSDDPEDLHFKAGQVIAVTDQGDGPESWWEGEIEGRTGTFPGTFVKSLASFATSGPKTFTAPEDQDPNEAAASVEQEPSVPVVKAVRFNETNNTVHDTHETFAYERSADFDPERSHAQWELEEPAETRRMLEDRWAYFETKLPAGEKCEERLAFEAEEARKEEERRKKQEQADLKREERKRKLQEARAKREAAKLAKEQGQQEPAATVAEGSVDQPDATETAVPNDRAARLAKLREQRAKAAAEARSAAPAPPAPQPTLAPAEPTPPPVTSVPSDDKPDSELTREEKRARLRARREERERAKAAQENGADVPSSHPEAEIRTAAASRSAAPPPVAPKPAGAAQEAARVATEEVAVPVTSPPLATPETKVEVQQEEEDHTQVQARAEASSTPTQAPTSALASGAVTASASASGPEQAEPSAAAEVAEPVADEDDKDDKEASPAPTQTDEDGPLDKAIASLTAKINELKVKSSQNVNGFAKEFYLLDREDRARFQPEVTKAGRMVASLNRYTDIIPYDNSRVELGGEGASMRESYINASHIKGLLPGSPHFIAAQGPLPTTCSTFWKMIIQKRSRVLVMVTNLVEKGRRKCEQYWPDQDEPLTFEADGSGPGATITCVEEKDSPAWVKRVFDIKVTDQPELDLTVTQVHYTGWPDRGVPSTVVSFLNFLHTAMAAQNAAHNLSKAAGVRKSPPMTVHCSAGVGRTGVFILVYSVLTYLPYVNKDEKYALDVLATVRRMRTFRRYLVQTQEQYEFCYTTILHATKFYRDGSRQLRSKSRSPSTTQPPAAPSPATEPAEPSSSTAEPALNGQVRELVSSATAAPIDDTMPQPMEKADQPTPVAAAVEAGKAEAAEDAQSKPVLNVVSLEDAVEPNPADAPSGAVNAAPSNTRPTATNSKPVWLHVCNKSTATKRLLSAGQEHAEGQFLVFMENMKRTLVRTDEHNKVVYAQVKTSSSGLSFGKEHFPGCKSLPAALDELRLPKPLRKAAFRSSNIQLSDYVPRPDATPEELSEEDDKAARFATLAQRHAEGRAMSTGQMSLASATSQSGSEISVLGRGDSAASLDSTGSPDEGTKRKKTFRSRAMGSFRKMTGKKKSNASLSGLSNTSSATDLKVNRIADFTPPGPAITTSPPKDGGDILQLSGRSHYLTFLNGVYVELSMQFKGYPVYRTQEPVGKSHGHLQGQYVYMYYDSNSQSWVVFLNHIGPVASCRSSEGDPVVADGQWMIVNKKNELVPDRSVNIERLDAMPATSHRPSICESDMLRDENAALKEDLAAMRMRLKALEAVDKEQTGSDQVQQLMQQLKESHEREADMNAKCLKLSKRLIALKSGGDVEADNAAAANGMDEEAQRRIALLDSQLKSSQQTETMLRSRVANLTKSEDVLFGRVRHMEGIIAEHKRQLEEAKAAEKAATDELVVCKMQLAELKASEDSPGRSAIQERIAPSNGNGVGAMLQQVLDLSGLESEEDILDDEDVEEVEFHVIQNYTARADDEIDIEEGDIVYVTYEDEDGYYVGRQGNRSGRFPTFCVAEASEA
eukprot:TRINITY_DN11475_c0_g1_i1.p1 TRINITY_DN11475_c0_g1~~TRINITY_DN11475_c0_g1_i1.p1  ORF type:complete len:1545 (+),score=458.13 TRINITY_DN11475_c0_g1_i1:42-4676(+)